MALTLSEYFKIRKRASNNCGIECDKCPLSSNNNGRGMHCGRFENEYQEESIAILEKWEKEHHVVTLQEKFFEVFPNALKGDNGTPRLRCPSVLGYENDKSCGHCDLTRCKGCWGQPYREIEK